MATMTTLRNPVEHPSTVERRLGAEALLRRNLGITDSARERVRTKLIDVPIEESPVKRRGRDEEVFLHRAHPVAVKDKRSITEFITIWVTTSCV
jgi:hypothetical protein